jgi:hypothetical protein
MNELSKFTRWADKESPGRGLICHLYISESEKQYYSKTDYAYFNLLSDSRNWIVKGTTAHGIASKRGKVSLIPCLNLFEVDDKFYKALDLLSNEGNKRFDLGIVFNKRKLKGSFGKAKVVDVRPIVRPPDPFPSPKECHHYDWARSRHKLWPFNQCDVVRLEIPESDFGLPIAIIPYQAIMGMLTRRKDYHGITKIVQDTKRWDTDKVQIFPLL